MAEGGDSCVQAFALAARQFLHKSENEIAPLATANVFRTLAMIARNGGDIGTALVFSEAGLMLADEALAEHDPARGPFVLAHALTLRLSGWPNCNQDGKDLVDGAIKDILAGTNPHRKTLADLEQARANFTRATHNLPLAIKQYEVALETRQSAKSSHDLSQVDNEVWLASALLRSGDVDRAQRLFSHCRQDLIALDLTDHHLMVASVSGLAGLAEMRQDSTRAIAQYEWSYVQLRQAQKSIFPGFSQRRLDAPILNALTYFYLRDGSMAKAWYSYAEARHNIGLQAQALKKARQFRPDLAAQVHQDATGAASFRSEVESSLRVLRSGTFTLDAVKQAVTVLQDYAKAMAKTYASRDLLRSEFGEDLSRVISIDELQDRLRPNQAFLGYFSTNAHDSSQDIALVPTTYAVVVRKNLAPQWTLVLPPDAQINQRKTSLIIAYNKLMKKASEWPMRLPRDPEVTRLHHELFQIYFAPIESQLADCDEIFLQSTEVPGGISFPALVDSSGQHLLDSYVFQDIIGIEDVGTPAAHQALSESVSLVLGDPAYGSHVGTKQADSPSLAQAISTYANTVLPRSLVTSVLKDGEAGLDRLPRLASSGWEARSIAAMTSPVILLTGKDATEQELFRFCGGSQPREFKWIHLATHALAHQKIPEQSALALSPSDGQGLLYVEEIGYGWALNCDLVTLSGCQTGRGPASWSAGQLGFIQALHAAGARHLLLSTAKIDDIATALLMERFYANISDRPSPRVKPAQSAPLGYSNALADAQRWLRDLQTEDGKQPFEHPVYWANFKLFGGGID